ncbi:FAD-linked oxidoreductase [Physcia stellaris]|nr:FAD-linked oxidoreductase [Physcia stellaris]
MLQSIAIIVPLLHILTPVTADATANDWDALSSILNGNLHKSAPFGQPCFSTFNGSLSTEDTAQCTVIQDNYLNTSFRTSTYHGTIHNQCDACSSDPMAQCLLDPTNPFKIPTSEVCNRGILSERYIQVNNAQDVQAALNFSLETGTTLSIKATGHDYLARSSRRGSLALWTRNLKNMAFHEAFVPAGSTSKHETYRAITIGAGLNVGEVTRFANTHQSTVVGGSSTTATAAGGFSLLGGHGVLSPTYGLAVDRILEIEIVTGDGEHRIVNAHQGADLFTALRGAGAGSFGVVLSQTIKVEKRFPVSFATLALTTRSPAEQLEFLALLAESTPALSKEGWGGPMGSSFVALVNPIHPDITSANASSALQPLIKYVNARNGTVSFVKYASYFEFYRQALEGAPETSVGTSTFVTFRTVPKSFNDDPSNHAKLSSFFAHLISQELQPTLFLTTPANAPVPDHTSLHPAWRDAYWLLGTQVSYAFNATLEQRKTTTQKLQAVTKMLEELSPGNAFYPNEADPWTVNWKEGFWADKYEHLVAVKKKYDPHGLFQCWKCVGYEEEKFQDGNCLRAFQV